MVRHSIAELRETVPGADMRIVGIYRRLENEPDRFIVCEGPTLIEPGDEVFVLSAREHLQEVLSALHCYDQTHHRGVERIMIAGGGRVGLRLAKQLFETGRNYQIKVLERDHGRCVQLASELPPSVLVLHGDGTDEDLLDDEGIEKIDLFLSLTSDDEDNIMASLLAKRLGATRVLALINRRSYADLMHGTQIDIALSPAQTMLGELLAYVRQGDVQAVHSVRRGVAEALEIVARGDRKTSRVVGRKISDIQLPKGAQFGLIMRGLPEIGVGATPADETPALPAKVIIARGDTVIESNDHVVIFVPRKRLIRDVEKLFRVSATFF
jgi:trk system potassium uptake protein TrkA